MIFPTYGPCPRWMPAKGAARYWCDHCGFRADIHPGAGRLGEAVARMTGRAAS